MIKNLVKIRKIALGISELFTAMDKGFAKVEQDLVLLRKFREICFNANEKLEISLDDLKEYLPQPLATSEVRLNDIQKADLADILHQIEDIIYESIGEIADYTENFSELWKKSFSLNALLKFKSLLVKEFALLQEEVNSIEMVLHMDAKRREALQNSRSKSIEQDLSS